MKRLYRDLVAVVGLADDGDLGECCTGDELVPDRQAHAVVTLVVVEACLILHEDRHLLDQLIVQHVESFSRTEGSRGVAEAVAEAEAEPPPEEVGCQLGVTGECLGAHGAFLCC